MAKIRLLWYGDSPACTTGFGRVAQGVLENLYQTGRYEISVLGINHPVGDPHRYEGVFRIYPARTSGNVYGLNRIAEVIGKEKPHVILINNDLWIASKVVANIPEGNRIISYSPVDALPVQDNWLEPLLQTNTMISTYTEFAKKAITDTGLLDDVSIIGHGVDTDEFYPISDARRFLMNVPDEAFVALMVNRNQPRKRLDLFLKAMSMWLNSIPTADRENILCYYHGAVQDIGYDLISLAKRWGIDDRLLVTDQASMTASNGVSLSTLCKIYNSADVNVLTSLGEGWGLATFESAACGKMQIVPNHSACTELWTGRAPLIDIKFWEVQAGGINTEGGVIDTDHLVKILDNLYRNRPVIERYAKLAYDYVTQERFTWASVAGKFDVMINNVLSENRLSKKIVGTNNDLLSANQGN
jgi:D-inositol-3-phosphate glycosyltransferase